MQTVEKQGLYREMAVKPVNRAVTFWERFSQGVVLGYSLVIKDLIAHGDRLEQSWTEGTVG